MIWTRREEILLDLTQLKIWGRHGSRHTRDQQRLPCNKHPVQLYFIQEIENQNHKKSLERGYLEVNHESKYQPIIVWVHQLSQCNNVNINNETHLSASHVITAHGMASAAMQLRRSLGYSVTKQNAMYCVTKGSERFWSVNWHVAHPVGNISFVSNLLPNINRIMLMWPGFGFIFLVYNLKTSGMYADIDL